MQTYMHGKKKFSCTHPSIPLHHLSNTKKNAHTHRACLEAHGWDLNSAVNASLAHHDAAEDIHGMGASGGGGGSGAAYAAGSSSAGGGYAALRSRSDSDEMDAMDVDNDSHNQGQVREKKTPSERCCDTYELYTSCV